MPSSSPLGQPESCRASSTTTNVLPLVSLYLSTSRIFRFAPAWESVCVMPSECAAECDQHEPTAERQCSRLERCRLEIALTETSTLVPRSLARAWRGLREEGRRLSYLCHELDTVDTLIVQSRTATFYVQSNGHQPPLVRSPLVRASRFIRRGTSRRRVSEGNSPSPGEKRSEEPAFAEARWRISRNRTRRLLGRVSVLLEGLFKA